jgi:iron only hydrogenase large subunit-like protein
VFPSFADAIADSAVSRHREADGSVVEIHSDGSRRKLPTAKISLQDCLACRCVARRAAAARAHRLKVRAVVASHLLKAFSSSK